jgi:hypothetical protein
MEAPWLTALRSRWQTDEECWADLFRPFAWRRPLLTYPFQFGRRVMWKLASDREPAYAYDLFGRTESPDTVTTRLRRQGTHEFFWGKAYRGSRAEPGFADMRLIAHDFLKDAPYDSILPLMRDADHGDIYGFDPEIANGHMLTPADALNVLSQDEYELMVAFAAQTIPALRDYPIDMLFDFQIARTSRGLTFLHFEPHPFAPGLLAG